MFENVLQRCIDEFTFIQAKAEEEQTCKRKAVGCSVCLIENLSFFREVVATNGPSRPGHECTNVVGGCGCSHAEPRAVMQLKGTKTRVMFCTYSPCTNCANIILDSGLIHGLIYEILTEHDVRGVSFLQASMPVLTRAELEISKRVMKSPDSTNQTQHDILEKTSAYFRRWYSHSAMSR